MCAIVRHDLATESCGGVSTAAGTPRVRRGSRGRLHPVCPRGFGRRADAAMAMAMPSMRSGLRYDPNQSRVELRERVSSLVYLLALSGFHAAARSSFGLGVRVGEV